MIFTVFDPSPLTVCINYSFLHLSRSSSEGTWLTVCCYLFTAVESCSHGNSGKRYNQNMDSQPVPIKMRKRMHCLYSGSCMILPLSRRAYWTSDVDQARLLAPSSFGDWQINPCHGHRGHGRRNPYILGGTKNLKWVTWRDHAPFRDSLSFVGWDLLGSTWIANFKSLA